MLLEEAADCTKDKFQCSCRLVRSRTLAFQAKNVGLNPTASTKFQWGVGGNWEPTSLAPRSREFDSRTLHHLCIRVVQWQNAPLIRERSFVRFKPWVPFSVAGSISGNISGLISHRLRSPRVRVPPPQPSSKAVLM